MLFVGNKTHKISPPDQPFTNYCKLIWKDKKRAVAPDKWPKSNIIITKQNTTQHYISPQWSLLAIPSRGLVSGYQKATEKKIFRRDGPASWTPRIKKTLAGGHHSIKNIWKVESGSKEGNRGIITTWDTTLGCRNSNRKLSWRSLQEGQPPGLPGQMAAGTTIMAARSPSWSPQLNRTLAGGHHSSIPHTGGRGVQPQPSVSARTLTVAPLLSWAVEKFTSWKQDYSSVPGRASEILFCPTLFGVCNLNGGWISATKKIISFNNNNLRKIISTASLNGNSLK